MENSRKWYAFMEAAQTLLLQGQAFDRYKPTIQIAIEPSFSSSVFLQLVLNDENVQWYRTTWLRLIDAPKFFDPAESLKYIGQTIQPSFTKETGTIKKEKIHDIIDFIRTLSLKPNLGKPDGFTLDGIYYTIVIGVENIQSTFKWHYLPDSWSDLAVLAAMLEELNSELK